MDCLACLCLACTVSSNGLYSSLLVLLGTGCEEKLRTDLQCRQDRPPSPLRCSKECNRTIITRLLCAAVGILKRGSQHLDLTRLKMQC